jgi:hypothetical protein
MYSYEDRIRAVKLCIKLDKRLGATIRKLGYPTKNSLIGCHREYERSLDLRVGTLDEDRNTPISTSMLRYSIILITIGTLLRPCGHWAIHAGRY